MLIPYVCVRLSETYPSSGDHRRLDALDRRDGERVIGYQPNQLEAVLFAKLPRFGFSLEGERGEQELGKRREETCFLEEGGDLLFGLGKQESMHLLL